MTRFYGFLIILFAALTPHRATAGELFSVRCEASAPDRPYFATFDIDAKGVVFETPPVNAETYFGSNVRTGEITSAADDGGREIRFMLRVPSGRVDPIFSRSQNTMIWPGIDNGSFRPTLTHKCTVTPPRSILSLRVRDPIQNPISVRCDHTGWVYFSMDVASKQAVYERGKEGMMYGGEVTGVSDDEITLLMKFDTPRQVVWSKSRQTITVEGIEGDPSSPRTELKCQEVTPRTMMVYYERDWRSRKP